MSLECFILDKIMGKMSNSLPSSLFIELKNQCVDHSPYDQTSELFM